MYPSMNSELMHAFMQLTHGTPTCAKEVGVVPL